MCAPKNNAYYAYTALFEHWFMKFDYQKNYDHLCKYFEIKFKPSTTYASWTNGLVEGTNRIIGQFIRTLVEGKFNDWSRKAKFFPYAYNAQYQTRLGISPYEVVFKQKPRKPTQVKLGTITDNLEIVILQINASVGQNLHTHSPRTTIQSPKTCKSPKRNFCKVVSR